MTTGAVVPVCLVRGDLPHPFLSNPIAGRPPPGPAGSDDDDDDDAATGGARVSHLGENVVRQVDDAIQRAAQGKARFPRHDGKVFENLKRGLPNAESGYYTEWTAAAAGAKRGADRVIIGGTPARPDVIYYWNHAGNYVLLWP